MKPICGYYNGCKKPTTITIPIRGYCNGCKNQQLLWNLYVGITMDVKNQQLLRYLYAGIAHLKWPYGNYNRKDVGIAQCSFWSL
jgi:hypothetical protein